MKYRIALLLSLLALTAAAFVGCDSANPVAPAGTVLTVTANPTQISLNGTSTITVVGFRPDGNPLNPGTQVTLSTDLGNLPSVVTADSQGRATAILTADGRTGPATITANLTSGGEASATTKVQIGESDTTKPGLTINVSPSQINIEQESVVSVLVRNSDLTPRAGETVRLRTTLGVLDATSLTTNANGEAQTVLRPDGRSGTAGIRGTAGASAEVGPVDVTILGTRVILTANPSTLDVGETGTLTVLVRDTNNIPLVDGHDVRLTASLGTFRDSQGPTSAQVRTDSAGEASIAYVAGPQAGTETINAFLANSEAVNVNIEVRDAPASFFFEVNTDTVNQTANTITLSATVTNDDGRAVPGILVTFDSDIGSSFDPSSSVTTSSTGRASAVVTFSVNSLPTSGSRFQVGATVRIAGVDVRQFKVITVD